MASHNTRNPAGVDSRAQITSTTVYQHPDGGRIWVTSNNRIGITEAWEDAHHDPDVAALPIGVGGLKLLAYALLSLATELETGAAQ